MGRDWFEPEGAGALVIAALFAVAALGVLAWLRGPGSRPFDPPIAKDNVRFSAVVLTVFAIGFVVRGLAGPAWFVIGSVVVFLAILAVAVVRRAPIGRR